MAKKPKETNIPLIFALVLFILATIAFGVMWYMGLAEVEKLTAEKKKAVDDQTPLRAQKDDAERMLLLYRVYLGTAEDADRNTIKTEAKANDKYAAELEKINYAVAKQFSKPGEGDKTDYDTLYNKLPETLQVWKLVVGSDGGKTVAAPPTAGLVQQYATLIGKDIVYDTVKKEVATYTSQIEVMKKAIAELGTSKTNFDTKAKELADEKEKVALNTAKDIDKRTEVYQKDAAAKNIEIQGLKEQIDVVLANKLKTLERDLKQAKDDLAAKTAEKTKADRETFTFDEPQGKVLRRRADGAIEISLGSAVGVRPGLTFSVFPPDYPQKGPKSRMPKILVKNSLGEIEEKQSPFPLPKAMIEVYEVVSANLSLARITKEDDPIRDGATVGDLLYNSAWRKGVGDHIALIGIFDINGDGIDDIESVVRDLTKMGIPVDAYYDMKNRKWVGQVTERTRYIVEGFRQIVSNFDPARPEKEKLLGAIEDAITLVSRKGSTQINFRDFFSRMGYKYRLDVTDDKINQATTPYLSTTGAP